MPSLTHALLLAAGLGTRLRPLTTVRAKPAIPVAGVPMVRRIIRWLAASGVTEVVLNLHHRPESIAAEVGDGADLGVRARYSWEQPEVLGSAGGPRQALDIVGAETFLLVNGDTITDLALAPLVAAHSGGDEVLVTMAVVPNERPQQYGGLLVDDSGAVLGVVPRGAQTRSYHFVGVQVVRRAAFAGLEPGRFANSVGDQYARLIAARHGSVRAHLCDARFWDIGTIADYWTTSLAFAREERDLVDPGTQIHDSARVTRCIAWRDVVVDEGCQLDRCILTDGVRIGHGRAFNRAVLLRDASGGVVAHPFEASFT